MWHESNPTENYCDNTYDLFEARIYTVQSNLYTIQVSWLQTSAALRQARS